VIKVVSMNGKAVAERLSKGIENELLEVSNEENVSDIKLADGPLTTYHPNLADANAEKSSFVKRF